MKTIIFLMLIVYSTLPLLAQKKSENNNNFTKNQIYRLFKQSSNKSKNENIWITCNIDNSFLFGDTIKLYNSFNYVYHSDKCCYYTGWIFKRKKSFQISNIEICKEPPIQKTNLKLIKIRIKRIKKELILTTYDNKSIINNYKILNVKTVELWAQGEICPMISFVRQSK